MSHAKKIAAVERVIISGAGGHCKVVIDAIEREGRFQVAFITDENRSRHGTCVLGYPVHGHEDLLSAVSDGISHAFVAIGDNAARQRVAKTAVDSGLSLINVVHPSAIIAPSVKLGMGILIMPGSIINADARIGNNVIINTGAVVEHDCVVSDDVHIAPNSTLCGGVVLGTGTMVGAGSVLVPRIQVGDWVRIGAGSTVIADVKSGVTAVGSPCRILA